MIIISIWILLGSCQDMGFAEILESASDFEGWREVEPHPGSPVGTRCWLFETYRFGRDNSSGTWCQYPSDISDTSCDNPIS